MHIPYYLQAKLESANLLNIVNQGKYNELLIFKWLKDIYPSISYNVLYDLYAIYHKYEINTIHPNTRLSLVKAYKSLLPTYLPLNDNIINAYMDHALQYAQIALLEDEVPIGAVVVYDNKIIGYGYNQTVTHNNVIYHAEIIAIQMAAQAISTYRLTQCDLYVTIEPCIMCVGAILHSRLRRALYGATEPKTGGVISQNTQIVKNKNLNHHTEFIGPINNDKYSKLLKDFFANKRIKHLT